MKYDLISLNKELKNNFKKLSQMVFLSLFMGAIVVLYYLKYVIHFCRFKILKRQKYSVFVSNFFYYSVYTKTTCQFLAYHC